MAHMITIRLDALDHETILNEINKRRAENRYLPDGESDELGGTFAEVIRDLDEYRSLWDRDHPKTDSQPTTTKGNS